MCVCVILFTAVSTVSATFTTPTNAYKIYVQICYLEVNPNWIINVEIKARNSITPLSILWFSQCRFSCNLSLLDAITQEYSILNVTQTGQEMWKVQLQTLASLITLTKRTIFIHYIHLLYRVIKKSLCT